MNKRRNTRLGSVWAGTLDALNHLVETKPLIDAKRIDGIRSEKSEQEDNYTPNLHIIGNTAIVNIKGTLSTDSSIFDEYFGVVGYPALRHAVMSAVTDPNVERILMMIDSGGGQVSGLSDFSSFLGKVAKVKPLLAHTTGNMCSAAYHIACNAQYITAGETAEVGSIGTVMVHMEITEMLEKEGFKATIIRSGPYKYLGNQFEKLDEHTLATLQAGVDTVDNLFVKHVAEKRGKSEDFVRMQQGQGRTFIGVTAKDVGLVDGVYNYDDMMIKVMSGEFDKVNAHGHNTYLGDNGMNLKKVDTATLQAMASQGISLDQPITGKTNESTETEIKAVEAAPNTEAAVTKTDDATVEGKTIESFSGETVASDLAAQLAAKDETIMDLKVEARIKSNKILELEASLESMSAIVATSAKNLAVGLGHSGSDFSALNPAALVDQHNKLAASFVGKYSAGGVAAVTANSEPKQTQPMSAREAAMLNSTKLA